MLLKIRLENGHTQLGVCWLEAVKNVPALLPELGMCLYLERNSS